MWDSRLIKITKGTFDKLKTPPPLNTPEKIYIKTSTLTKVSLLAVR